MRTYQYFSKDFTVNLEYFCLDSSTTWSVGGDENTLVTLITTYSTSYLSALQTQLFSVPHCHSAGSTGYIVLYHA